MAQSLDELSQQAGAAESTGDYTKAKKISQKAIRLYPNKSSPYFWLGNALDDLGKKEEAIAAYRQAIKLQPDFAAAYNNLGNALDDLGKLEGAIAAYRKAIELDPKYAAAYYNLGIALRQQGKLEDAIAAYRQVNKLQPDYADAYYNLRNALYEQSEQEKTRAEIEKMVIYIRPNSYTPPQLDSIKDKSYNNMGNTLIDKKKRKEAIKAYKKAIKLDLQNATAYNNLGLALIQERKRKEAIKAYRQAIKLQPNYAEAYNNLGIALKEEGTLGEAILQLHKAISLDPQSSIFNGSLGDVLKEQNKLEEAISQYRKTLSLNDSEVSENLPNGTFITRTTAHTVVHNNLGLLYQQQGKLKEALAEYEAALKIDPKFEYAKNNRDAVLALLKQPTELAYTDTRYLRPDDPLTRPKRAVVLLTPIFPQGRNQQGTGFIIKRTDNKLWILTNRHVLTDSFYSDSPRTCDSVEVQIYPGDKPRDVRIAVLSSKIILIANDLDLALIELEASQLPTDIQALAISDPSDNQPITTIGHPDKEPWQKDQGKVIDVDNEKLRLKISLAIGSSGSPVMTENYGVIGIIYKIDQEGTGYAIPISQIRKQLATWKVQLP
jgi:superkiller protein 3